MLYNPLATANGGDEYSCSGVLVQEHAMVQIDDLQNKAVLITGASTGIGAALSRAFAKQGARVAVHWRSHQAAAEAVVRDIEAAGGTGLLIQAI